MLILASYILLYIKLNSFKLTTQSEITSNLESGKLHYNASGCFFFFFLLQFIYILNLGLKKQKKIQPRLLCYLLAHKVVSLL